MDIRVTGQVLTRRASEMYTDAKRVDRLRDKVAKVSRSSVMDSVPSSCRSKLGKITRKMDEQTDTLSQMGSALNTAADMYDKTESRILVNHLSRYIGATFVDPFAYGQIGEGVSLGGSGVSFGVAGFSAGLNLEFFRQIRDLIGSATLSFPGILTTIDKIDSILTDIDEGKFVIAEASGELESKLYSTTGSVSGLDYEVYGGKLSADGYVQLTNGTIALAASAEYVAAGATGTYESEFGTTRGTVEAGVIEANVDARLDLASGDIYASGDVGVYAGKASVSHSGSVSGVDYSVGVEGTVGIGAHFDVGIQDGVINFDVGAAVGIGGSIKFSLDIGGIAENISGGVEGLFGWVF